MKKFNAAVLAVALLFLGTRVSPKAILGAKEMAPPRQEAPEAFYSVVELYPTLFREPYEVVYFQTFDGRMFMFTTREDRSVSIDPMLIIDILEKAKVRLADVILVVHNHFGARFFSTQDIKFYNILRSLGFTGRFVIWETTQEKAYELQGR